jgi:hypothetical protein
VFSCEWCGARAIPIVYGYPSEEMFAAEKRKEIALGGCCVEPDAPDAECPRCGEQWRV